MDMFEDDGSGPFIPLDLGDSGAFVSVPIYLWPYIQHWLIEGDPFKPEEYWIAGGKILRGRRFDENNAGFQIAQIKLDWDEQMWIFN